MKIIPDLSLSIETSIGLLTIDQLNNKIVSIRWTNDKYYQSSILLKKTTNQILEFLDKKRTNFEIPLNPIGTNNQKKIWDQLLKISYGSIKSYLSIAEAIGSHPRVIASACAANPIPIIVPCHRVIAKNGNLSGYSGGTGEETKLKLLEIEGNNLKNKTKMF
tara:strand:- start:1330 stop:1815 length:486 start_codon:yes stop_codon:yes gene_type:complete